MSIFTPLIQSVSFLFSELHHHHSQEVLNHLNRHTTSTRQPPPQHPHNWGEQPWDRLRDFVRGEGTGGSNDRTTTTTYWEDMKSVGALFYQATTSSVRQALTLRHNQQQQAATAARQNRFRAPPPEAFHHASYGLEQFGLAPLIPNEDDHDFLSNESQPRQQQRNGFVFLPEALRFRPSNEGWANVANLDLYFQSLYAFYYHRGMVPIVAKGIVQLVTLFFSLVLSVFLFAYVDWTALAQCTDENTCRTDFVQGYIREHPFAKFSVWNVIVVSYMLIFCLYGVFSVLSFVNNVQEASRAKWVYEDRLGISAQKLLGGAVDWDRDVVSKLMALQQSGEYRVAIHNTGHEFDALVIANRILRKENYMVAFFNRGLLNLSVPFASVLQQTYFCSTIEWSIHFCVFNFMFNHKYQVRPAFYLDPQALRRRFQLCGVAHILFMPFLLFFVMIYFGLQNMYDWKSTRQYLGPRFWSQPAKWTFREFNELPHLFERRLGPSYNAAETYVGLFGTSEIVAAIGRILVFIGGSLGAVLFAFAAINDAILLHVKIADWNLLWYAGVFGMLYSGGKVMIPDAKAEPKSARNLFAEIDQALMEVAKHTHHYPDTWKGRGWDQATYKIICSMFQYKSRLLISEIISLILAPYILCVSLAMCAETICEFVLATKTEIIGAGEVCGYATFDFDKFCDETWEGRTIRNEEPLVGSLTESIFQTRNVDEATRNFPKPKARHGKMEKSFFSFRVCIH